MKILILSTSFSGLTQRVQRELVCEGHDVYEHYDLDPGLLREQCESLCPNVIICPFLTQRIPEDIWQRYLCLVVHPGIVGDRGPSSIDWSIVDGESEWGVTLLQADEEMDMGDIWGTEVFPMRDASKMSIYKREVSSAAVSLIHKALADLEVGGFEPQALDYSNPQVKGRLRDYMKQEYRAINWQEDTTDTVIRKIRAADTSPGVRDVLENTEVNLFGAIREPKLSGEPGRVIATYKGAICRATVDGAVWIRQLKTRNSESLPPIKLPASMVYRKIRSHEFPLAERLESNCVAEDISIVVRNKAAYVYFNFYNGAFSTRQCQDLKNRIRALKQTDCKYIVLMGGEDFFSNGIHLNCIEAASDPANEALQNITAMDDLVLEIINSPEQMTIAALRNNAGAGGAVLALACDQIIIRDGVVLNPHYQSMGLYGSEYWTYLVPKRIGRERTEIIMSECKPMLAAEAMKIGLVDLVFPEGWRDYHNKLDEYCEQIDLQVNLETFLDLKSKSRLKDEKAKPLWKYRHEELAEMRKNFFDPDSSFHEKRRAFVYKLKAKKTVEPAKEINRVVPIASVS